MGSRIKFVKFSSFLYCKCVHTTEQISRYVLDNFNHANIRELLIIQTEKSRERK